MMEEIMTIAKYLTPTPLRAGEGRYRSAKYALKSDGVRYKNKLFIGRAEAESISVFTSLLKLLRFVCKNDFMVYGADTIMKIRKCKKIFHRVNLAGKALYLLVFFSAMYLQLPAQFYNGSQLAFGKNRVQFSDKFRTYYRFNNFDTYFYIGGKSLAIFTAKYADDNISTIQKKLDYNLENKIQFIIFNRLSDLKESNIGLVSDEKYNVGGITHISGSRVFIYFDGNHENLKRQIKAGIAQVVLNELMYGEQITAKIKNSTLLSLPEWYSGGLISYLSEDWNTDIDNCVKDGILTESYDKFNRLSGIDAIYSGHSIWKYIAEKYGEEKISNILYITKISKNVESGFLYVLGVSYKTLIREWFDYYDKKYYLYDKKTVMPEGEKLLKKKNTKRVVQQFKLSPDGRYAAFVTNESGQYKVWLYNFKNKKLKKIMKAGFKLDEKTDYTLPVLAWRPAGNRLAIITEKKEKIFLNYYNPDEKKYEKQLLSDFQKIIDFSYSQNGKLLALSGVQNGQTDIYVYNPASHTYEQITKDIYDDFNPVFFNNSKQIIFSSNRDNDTIKPPSKDSVIIPDSVQDLFLYDYANKNKVLRRLTNTAIANETNPVVIDESHISYLSDRNGTVNRITAKPDSSISFVDTTTHYRYFITSYPQTNYSRNILNYDINAGKSKCGEIIYYKGKNQIYLSNLAPVDNLSGVELENSPYMEDLLKKKNIAPDNTAETSKENNTKAADTVKVKRKRLVSVFQSDTAKTKIVVDIDNYAFSNDKPTVKKDKVTLKDSVVAKKDTSKTQNASAPDFVLPRQRNYDVEYSIDKLVNQIDFSYLNNTYQPFTNADNPIFINPGLNALLKVGVTDLFEDYRITGGVRVALDLDNSEYIFSFENLIKRLDRQIIFHRQTMKNVYENSIIKQNSNEILCVLKWPFSQVTGLKGTALLRNDRAAYLATDYVNLNKPSEYYTRTGIKAELTFDNTRGKAINIYFGTRWKLFAEIYRQLDEKRGQLNVLGFDFRNYQKINRTFIWANRFAASTSFGSQKLVYYMGGVDNWLFPKFDQNINVATDQNYTYQTLATNMRGFKQNIRNGNSFAVINSELRLPVFRFLINKPVKSEFFNNFQVVGFGDLGTAWTGSNPYSDKNALYTNTIVANPITVTITSQKEPIVGGFGFGLRSKLLGYFVRADWAWGVDGGYVMPNVFYLSLNLDF